MKLVIWKASHVKHREESLEKHSLVYFFIGLVDSFYFYYYS
jgi:hypothetical protein